jgi:release factor glutamine methyltransferase
MRQVLSAWLIKKIQKYGPHKVDVLGNSYEISENVFNPKFYFTSRFMAEHINVKPDDAVLDMGTGAGIQAITAANEALRVVAVDINPEAVRFTRINARINGVENKVTVLEGDLFSPIKQGEKFDVILFTPPYLEGDTETFFDRALFDPEKTMAKRFFSEARDFLKQGGYVQMIYSSVADPESALKLAGHLGWHHTLVAEEKTFSEKFLIYRLTLS